MVLHYLRNPWGSDEEHRRAVRLQAADALEQAEARAAANAKDAERWRYFYANCENFGADMVAKIDATIAASGKSAEAGE